MVFTKQGAQLPDIAWPGIQIERNEPLANLPVRSKPVLSVTELRRYLQDRVPESMIPAAFVILDALPLTPNGKVNRKILMEYQLDTTEVTTYYVPPRNDIEKHIAENFADLLGMDLISVQDNFFDLGGHSLIATRLVARIRDHWGYELSLRTFFENPTVEAVARWISTFESSEEVKTHVTQWERVDRDQPCITSFAQQRLWVLEQLVKDNPFYNMPSAIRIQGPLNEEALRLSLYDLVERHETLRTVFIEHDGQPMQLITKPKEIHLEIEEVDGASIEEKVQNARNIVHQEALIPFNLEQGPLLRVRLLKLNHTDHVLVVVMHHIVSDGWSMSIFHRELSALYEARINHTQAQLSLLPIQYADFAAWQRKWLSSSELERQLRYWKERLDGLSQLELPTDFARPAISTFRGNMHVFQIDSKLTKRLEALSQTYGSTLYMTLLAIFQLMLHRYTGQRDIAVGSPIANRTQSEIEGLIGFFVNSLVMRANLSEDMTFTDLLVQVKESTLEAYAHQDLPFEKLVEELQPKRDLSRNPLFQVVFALQNAPYEELELAGSSVVPFEMDVQTTRFDLELHMWQNAGELQGYLVYSQDLFKSETMERMAEHFIQLVEGICENESVPISELPLTNESEYRQLLQYANHNPVVYDSPACIHHLITEWAEKQPDAYAIIGDSGALTYQELESRSLLLAQHLQDLGIGLGDRVAVCMGRSVDLIVSLVAILKVGAVYVPLDAAYPMQRCHYVVKDSAARLVMIDSSTSHLFEGLGVSLLCIDESLFNIETKPSLSVDVTPSDFAYIIYTSGSTGRPNGVSVTHQSIQSLVAWHRETFGLGTSDRCTQIAGTAFDAMAWEVWSTLGSGATLVLADDQVRLSPKALIQWFSEMGITVSFVPTPLAMEMLSEDWSEATPLRVMLTGGDRLT
ncbi:condensation domain-containing protein, partial [Thermoflavimicrobium daqui]|uniref:condensation domain-containing protein n=1 Tax=Thermoflavimicrobium daqui TaxID=2137476 RepID=UPI0011AB8662